MGGYVIILFYCITCIVSALYMLNTGMYGGEAYSVGRVHFSFIEIIIHLLIVVFGYFYIYHFYNRTKDKKPKFYWSYFKCTNSFSLLLHTCKKKRFVLSIKYFTFLWIAIITRLDWFFLGFDVDGSPD